MISVILLLLVGIEIVILFFPGSNLPFLKPENNTGSSPNNWKNYVIKNVDKLKESQIIVNASWDNYLWERNAMKSLVATSEYEATVERTEINQVNTTQTFGNGYKMTFKNRLVVKLPNGENYSFFFTENDLKNLKLYKKEQGRRMVADFNDLTKGNKITYIQTISWLEKEPRLISGEITIR